MAVDRKTFCQVFIPMANDGKSALEIGQKLGIEGADKKISGAVSAQAAKYRQELKTEATASAVKAGLNQEKTDELVASCVAKIPKLRKVGRKSHVMENFAGFLDDLLAAADTPE